MSIPTTVLTTFKPPTELAGGKWIQPSMDSKPVTEYVQEPQQSNPNTIGK